MALQDWNLLRIVFPDGDRKAMCVGTELRTASGEKVDGVVSVKLAPIEADKLLKAQIEVCVEACNLWVNPLLSRKSLAKAAAVYGLSLLDKQGQPILPEPEDRQVILEWGTSRWLWPDAKVGSDGPELDIVVGPDPLGPK